nr:hypothetical protein [uncultured Duganella sp.]
MPILTAIATPFLSDTTVRVQSVNFNLHELSISISSENWNVEVIFQQTYGFRVLNELDLGEFLTQPEGILANGWIFEVADGGWKNLELTRPNFVSGRNSWVGEYLIAGIDECVSVLSKERPFFKPIS